MSAPMKLTADQLRNLSGFLQVISRATRDYEVQISPHTGLSLATGSADIAVRWDQDNDEYVIDDRIGS